MKDANEMAPGETLPLYLRWPFNTVPMMLELRRADPQCDHPPLDASVIKGLGWLLIHELTLEGGYDATLTGTIGGPDKVPVFAFRLFYVPGYVGRPGKEIGADFDANDLDTVQATKQKILSATSNTDLLLFVGNTAR